MGCFYVIKNLKEVFLTKYLNKKIEIERKKNDNNLLR